ncbi:MAG TPA: poly(R)-hydroxyalkanoic acid synthase subunit PhaE, partial [Nitrococcus sp.]|nr:poly(R)-hydroxyalkanoic acid synthase subunit PhaE [Nitrococcus sp.]
PDNGESAQAAWAQGWYRGLLSDQGPQALAIWLAAGWSALAALASGENAALDQPLRESIAQLRAELAREISRPAEVIDTLLGLARQLLLPAWAAPAWLARIPPPLHPHLGPLQKEQANLDALQQVLSDYQAAALHYANALSELFEATLAEYRQELSAGALPKPTPQTMRVLHDRWVQIAEHAYERFLVGEEHTQAIGRLLNAWVDLQLALRPVADEILRHMGLPSRRDMDDVQGHLDRLQRQQRAAITQLQREITALRDELAAWHGEAPCPPLKPRSRKSPRS